MSMIQSDLLLGQEGGGLYEISRSIRFNSADSAYLSRTPASAGNRKTWTWAGWVKRSGLGVAQAIFGEWNGSAADGFTAYFTAADVLILQDYDGSFVESLRRTTTQVFRDVSAWYHIVVSVDTTDATADDRVKLYVNGSQVTTFSATTNPAQNSDTRFNRAQVTSIGRSGAYSASYYFSGYLADIHFIDGQALDPTSFGEFDTNGVWQPIAYSGTYGTNGFHLPFSDNSTAAALGTDTSGNNHTWIVNNISVAAGSGNDSLVDVPTASGEDTGAGGEVRGNYATLNPLSPPGLSSTGSLQNGNLEMVGTTSSPATVGTIGVNTGKWYAECVFTAIKVGADTQDIVGVQSLDALDSSTSGPMRMAGSIGYQSEGGKVVNNSFTSYAASWGNGDVIGVAVDIDGNQITFYKNGVSQGTLSYTFSNYKDWTFGTGFGGPLGTATYTWNFGQRPFAFPVSGFKALCTTNLPEPTIADGSTAMDVALYTGNGSTQTISGLRFSPDFAWIKVRNSTVDHVLYDQVRGAQRYLSSNTTGAEGDQTGTPNVGLYAFTSDGFSVGDISGGSYGVNGSSGTYVAWTWDAGSSTVTNNDGSITSQVRANPSAGFSVVTYTVGSNTAQTIGHGLGVAPHMIIVKERNQANNWQVYHSATGNTNYLYLNLTNQSTANNLWDNTSPTSTVFSIRSGGSSNFYDGKDHVAYCFAPVAGYSNAFSITGNDSTDGPFCHLGFRPRLIIYKRTDTSGDNWFLHDTARDTYNVLNGRLFPNTNSAESTNINVMDVLSNGFKLRTNDTSWNASGGTYVGFAWAEHPFQTARAR